MPPGMRCSARSPSRLIPLHRLIMKGHVGSSNRSVATMAAVCRRRRAIRSAMVPSSLALCSPPAISSSAA
eukprot:6192800-Pleurochrysis_carterae.AAC.1